MTRRPRYLIREVEPDDLDGLFALSRHLDSVNFPNDRAVLGRLCERSYDSFQGRVDDPMNAHFMFALVPDNNPRDIIGTSMVFAQHGTPTAPHVYFDVLTDERYSTTLDRHFRHTTLRLGFAYDGPSEIGALVLDPRLRSAGLGKPLSFVRFVFMAMYRDRFHGEVIAELMPPLEPDGRSRLWEHIGRRFTGLSYQEADKLSHTNKEFIISLFPMEMNATLLPDDVQALIGEVGPETQGVRRMLESIGFEYVDRIDPFDGGPHFHAPTDEVTVVQNTRPLTVAEEPVPEAIEQTVIDERQPVDGVTRALVAIGRSHAPWFRATPTVVRTDAGRVQVPAAAARLLGVEAGETVFVSPF